MSVRHFKYNSPNTRVVESSDKLWVRIEFKRVGKLENMYRAGNTRYRFLELASTDW